MEAFLKEIISWGTKHFYKVKDKQNYYILFDLSAIKLKIDSKQISNKYANSWRVIKMMDGSKKEIKMNL